MTKNQALVSAAVSSLIAVGALAVSTQASAQDMEKCYGVVSAGKNAVALKQRCGGNGISGFDIDELNALGAAADLPDAGSDYTNKFSLLGDDKKAGIIVDLHDRNNLAVAFGGLHVDDSFAAPGLRTVLDNLCPFAETTLGDAQNHAFFFGGVVDVINKVFGDIDGVYGSVAHAVGHHQREETRARADIGDVHAGREPERGDDFAAIFVYDAAFGLEARDE